MTPIAYGLFNPATGKLDATKCYVHEATAIAAAKRCSNRWRTFVAVPLFLYTETEGWRDTECMRLINVLRADEGDDVTILSDNADFNGQPNCAVECNGAWTTWFPRRFTGETLLDALTAAWIDYQRPTEGEKS